MKTYGEIDYRVALNFCVFFHDPQQKKKKKSSHEKKDIYSTVEIIYKHPLLPALY